MTCLCRPAGQHRAEQTPRARQTRGAGVPHVLCTIRHAEPLLSLLFNALDMPCELAALPTECYNNGPEPFDGFLMFSLGGNTGGVPVCSVRLPDPWLSLQLAEPQGLLFLLWKGVILIDFAT
jgi:hypothetical protein